LDASWWRGDWYQRGVRERGAGLALGVHSAFGCHGGGLEFEDDAGEVHVIPGFGDLSVCDVQEAGAGEG